MTNRLLKFAGFAILACLSSVSAAQSYKHDISFALGVNSPDEGETKNIVPLIYKKYFKALSFSKGPIGKVHLYSQPGYLSVGYQKTQDGDEFVEDIDSKIYAAEAVNEDSGGFVSAYVNKANKNRLTEAQFGIYGDGIKLYGSFTSYFEKGDNSDEDTFSVGVDSFYSNDDKGGLGFVSKLTRKYVDEPDLKALDTIVTLGASYYLNAHLGLELSVEKQLGSLEPTFGYELRYDVSEGFGLSIEGLAEESNSTHFLAVNFRL